MAFDYVSKVHALIAKANAEGTTPGEKKLLEDKAFELMDRHKIKNITQETKDEKSAHFPVEFGGAWVTRQISLFNVIAKHYDCEVIDATNNPIHATYYIFGYESDVDRTMFLYTILENQMLAELAKVEIPNGTSAKSYRNAWLWGYIIRIKDRLAESKKSAEKEAAPGYGIMLRDRSLAVKQEVSNVFPRLRTKGKSVYRGRDAFSQGQEAGSKAQFNIRDNVGGNGRRELT